MDIVHKTNLYNNHNLIYDEDTGDNVAVLYKPEYGSLFAYAPNLYRCLKALLEEDAKEVRREAWQIISDIEESFRSEP
jgi:hypothetical protein